MQWRTEQMRTGTYLVDGDVRGLPVYSLLAHMRNHCKRKELSQQCCGGINHVLLDCASCHSWSPSPLCTTCGGRGPKRPSIHEMGVVDLSRTPSAVLVVTSNNRMWAKRSYQHIAANALFGPMCTTRTEQDPRVLHTTFLFCCPGPASSTPKLRQCNYIFAVN